MWTREETRFLKSLKTPEKIQHYIDGLPYNPVDDSLSVRYVMLSGDAHCLEGGLVAAAALEFQGHPPLMVSIMAHNDDHHVITVYRGKFGWGSISKSNTALLKGRDPVYASVRELVMSYFDFYFNLKGEKALYAYSNPINLDRFKNFNWRTGDENLIELGYSMNDIDHYEIISQKALKTLSRATNLLKEACFLGADMNGLYKG
jgi:hypothetical protein